MPNLIERVAVVFLFRNAAVANGSKNDSSRLVAGSTAERQLSLVSGVK